MIYEVNNEGDKVEVTLKGRLTFADYNYFRQVIDFVFESDAITCTLYLAELDYIDSAGLGMFLLCREKMQEKNGSVGIKKPSGQVKKILELARFDSLFDFEY